MKLVCCQCGARYEQGKFCLECGSPLKEVQIKKVLYCNTCQIEVASGKFCLECGTKLEEREIVEDNEIVVESQKNIVAASKSTDADIVGNDNTSIENILSKYRDEWGDIRRLNKEEYAVAAEELQQCVDKGSAEAMYFLATLYMAGYGVEKNLEVAYNLFKKAEDKGSLYAKAVLGVFYLQGVVVELDCDEALSRLIEGYNTLNIPPIAGLLGYIYLGNGDYDKALKYATEAAEKNDKEGLYVLGTLYLNGYGVEKDDLKSFEYYIQAAAMGSEDAFNQLGWMYQNGYGVEEDPSQAYFWYNEAAQKGDNVGMYNLACCYKSGYGVGEDIEIAVEWYKKSADLGYVDAMFELADYYRESLIDYDKAKLWLKNAADKGNADAMNQLGVMYAIDNNYKEAIKWYKKAIEFNQPNAYRNLALCYRDGTGIEKDEKKALELLSKAEKLGIEDVSEIISELTNSDGEAIVDVANDLLSKKQYKKALEMYHEAAEQGNPRAIYGIGICYLKGQGVKKSSSKAIDYFIQAAKRAFPLAFDRLHELYGDENEDEDIVCSKGTDEICTHMLNLSWSDTMRMNRLDKNSGITCIKNLNLIFKYNSFVATADIEICEMKDKEVRVDYYLYSKVISYREKSKILKDPQDSWNIIVPYKAVKWIKMPFVDYGIVDIPKNEEKDYVLHIIVRDVDNKTILAQQEKNYRIKHTKPFFGKETWEIK